MDLANNSFHRPGVRLSHVDELGLGSHTGLVWFNLDFGYSGDCNSDGLGFSQRGCGCASVPRNGDSAVRVGVDSSRTIKRCSSLT